MNIFCVGQNYAKHAQELDNEVPKEPIFFQKASSCLSASDKIKIPNGRKIHYELELVVIFGKSEKNIPKGAARDHISHWCLGLDLTDRERQNKKRDKGLPWFDAKSFPGAAVITGREPIDWQILEQDFWLTKNGVEVQRGNVSDMVFDIPTLISTLSEIVTFQEGDFLFTGTPSGVGPLHHNDELSLGLGDKTKGSFYVTSS
ncbi:MAG TPA: FAA hydrolase family protein [Candidatus Marinimicrobia bacterium]|jgi:2-keto-4-pentenoate hydratase/2-oxohepta-3-ene-1,7-dioic acid hydratase in catechol pathway|nr:FAA hydrolase family protein [Candidatus Neomarinimicrobiota bacterium]HIO55773.1 FAA hydrolase family protein [Candidatus Neomarinimicrobiota bacterium]HIO89035.1 FAA hydrolase family protein [Candidatus Neomarinimicrobiota bacterium]